MQKYITQPSKPLKMPQHRKYVRGGVWSDAGGKVWDSTQQAWVDVLETVPEPEESDWNGLIPQLTSANSTNSGYGATCSFCTMSVSSRHTDYPRECYKAFDRGLGYESVWLSSHTSAPQGMYINLNTPQRLHWVKLNLFDNAGDTSGNGPYARSADIYYKEQGQNEYVKLSSVQMDSSHVSGQIFTVKFLTSNNISNIKIESNYTGQKYVSYREIQLW